MSRTRRKRFIGRRSRRLRGRSSRRKRWRVNRSRRNRCSRRMISNIERSVMKIWSGMSTRKRLRGSRSKEEVGLEGMYGEFHEELLAPYLPTTTRSRRTYYYQE